MPKYGDRIFSNNQPTENESLRESGMRVVKFATSENKIVNSKMFPHRNIHKYTWTFPDGEKQPH
jgi:hypothetical protein